MRETSGIPCRGNLISVNTQPRTVPGWEMHNGQLPKREWSYLDASFKVWILLSLSLGSVGMILRKDWKASLRLCEGEKNKIAVNILSKMFH